MASFKIQSGHNRFGRQKKTPNFGQDSHRPTEIRNADIPNRGEALVLEPSSTVMGNESECSLFERSNVQTPDLLNCKSLFLMQQYYVKKCHNSLPDSDVSISQVFVKIGNWEIKVSSSKRKLRYHFQSAN